MKHIFAIFAALLVIGVFFGGLLVGRVTAPHQTDNGATSPEDETVMCPMDAMQCPDGSFVGRTGPDCSFMCPTPAVPAEVQAEIERVADRIVLTTPPPLATVTSPLTVSGQARGMWYFEGSFPVSLVNWDGLIIAEGVATASGDWMTTEFVPFTATLTYTSPYTDEAPDFFARGALILQRDNPSGLPEYDDALEIPIRFTSTGLSTQE